MTDQEYALYSTLLNPSRSLMADRTPRPRQNSARRWRRCVSQDVSIVRLRLDQLSCSRTKGNALSLDSHLTALDEQAALRCGN